jgi:hypothetical protein
MASNEMPALEEMQQSGSSTARHPLCYEKAAAWRAPLAGPLVATS